MGPLFFILFINDLPLLVSSQIDLYADDTTITTSSDFRNISQLELSLNTSVSEIQLWANANKLPLNEEKTKVLMITGRILAPKLRNLPNVTTDRVKSLKIVNNATLLGLEIDNMLSFNLHVEIISKRRSSRIAVLRKIRVFLSLSQRLFYYNAIIRPVLSYVSVIWSSCDKELLNRVLKLQTRAARVILYADRKASSVAPFNKLHWIPFYEQCNMDKCSILYKRIHGTLPSYLDNHLVANHKHYLRSTWYANFNAICPKYKRETEGERTFAVSASRLWNNVPLSTRKVDSVACFKHGRWTCNPEDPGSNLPPRHWMDLSSVAPNSTPPRFVNSQLVSLPPVGILNLLCLICIIFVCYAHLIIIIHMEFELLT